MLYTRSPAPSRPPTGLPSTSAPDVAASASSSTSPPPAEIEATCLRATIAAIPGSLAEELSDVLLTVGASSVVVQEHRPPGAPEQEIYDDGEAKLWDMCDVVAHFPLEADVAGTLELAVGALEAELEAPLEYVVESVANEAWVEQIKASYVPLQITEDLWIIPEWSKPVDLSATNVILQPGVAFGTGEHPTTRLCLRELRRMADGGELQGAAVMDYGTGSGVLAIAALKYGAARAVGTDIDSLAVVAARRNAALNAYAQPAFVSLQCGAGIDDAEPLASATESDRSFDVVVANILRGPLVELATRLGSYARPGGKLLLSGILAEQAPEIQAAYAAEGFEDFKLQKDQQWALLTATKRAT
ncbi:hypothetical protein HYH03_006034 [Edaphochlamys debaryana]|uniref:ETFB lysine methyltransferase n=1 Tax=Edaphochlamys debaryana TaxID=47281 RepID=A0A836C0G1_9CHLO|nr:hypothetical protein HYH03_006034 [Edaphochlamys debaryana]|eukprot:KAG2495791.1 hypothetical protein HYH03_006034 [Edaphochlamys debaryana]